MNEPITTSTAEELPTPPSPLIPNPFLRVGLYFFAFVITAFISSILAALFIATLGGYALEEIAEIVANSDNINILMTLQVFSLCGTLLVTWLFTHYIDRRPFSDIGTRIQGRLKDAISGFLWGTGLIFTGFIMLWTVGAIEVIGFSFDPAAAIYLLVLFLVVSLNEEISMRGYVLGTMLDTRLRPFWSLTISAMLFGLLHALNPNVSSFSIFNIILAGYLLGIYYCYCRNLWFPIMLHWAWNYAQGPVFGFKVSGINIDSMVTQQNIGNTWLTGGNFGFEGSLLSSILMVIATIILYYTYRPNNLPPKV